MKKMDNLLFRIIFFYEMRLNVKDNAKNQLEKMISNQLDNYPEYLILHKIIFF